MLIWDVFTMEHSSHSIYFLFETLCVTRKGKKLSL